MKKLDLRVFEGRSPRCEIGMCRQKGAISIGDAGSRGGLGRIIMCEDHAKEIAGLILDHYEEITMEAEAPTEVTAEAEAETEEVEADPTDYESLSKAQLQELADLRKIEYGSKTTKPQLIELLILNG